MFTRLPGLPLEDLPLQQHAKHDELKRVNELFPVPCACSFRVRVAFRRGSVVGTLLGVKHIHLLGVYLNGGP